MTKSFIKKNFMPISMIAFSLMVYTIGIFLVSDVWSWTQGVLFGLLFSLLKFKLMEGTFNKAVGMSESKAKQYATMHYIIRYALTGAVLLIAAIEPSIDLLGVFGGMVSMKVAAYVQLFLKD